MKDSPRDVLDRIVEPFDEELDNWADVLKRAQAPRPRRLRLPRALTLTVAVVALALAAAAPFGLAGLVIGLFKDQGKPVPVASLSRSDREALILSMCSRVDLVTPAGKPPEKRCADGPPRIVEIANNGTRLYWKAVFRTASSVSPRGGSAATASMAVAAVTSDRWAAGRAAISSRTPSARSPSQPRCRFDSATAVPSFWGHPALPAKVSQALD